MKRIVLLPVLLFVLFIILNAFKLSGQPSIFVNGFHLDYGEVVLNQTYNANVRIINVGDQPLEISDIFFDSDDLFVDQTSFTINASGFQDVNVVFTPSVLGAFEGIMFIESNAEQQSIAEAPVLAIIDLPVAEYLVAENHPSGVTLSWGGNGEDGSWIRYDNGNVSSYVGFFSSVGQYVLASKWTSDDLVDMAGQFISKVAFFPTGLFADFNVQVRTGEDGQDIVYDGIASQINYFQWNEYILTQPVEIIAGQDYWLSLEITQSGDMQASVAYDTQLAEDGLSNLILVNDQWQTMSTYGYYSNWMIRGFIAQTAEKSVSVSASYQNNKPIFPTSIRKKEFELVNHDSFTLEYNYALLKNAEDLILGYNIYRDGLLLNDTPVNTSTFTDSNLESGTYQYEVSIVFDGMESSPLSKAFQVAAPELTLDPVSLVVEDIPHDEVTEFDLSFGNTGFSILEWEVGAPLPFWLSLSSSSGSIAAGESANLTLFIEPDGLMAGSHVHNIQISTNNTNKPDYFLQVYIFVTGQTVLAMTGTEFNFGRVAIGQTKSVQIDFTNISDALVYVLSPWYSPYVGFYSYSNISGLQPGQTGRVIMSTWPEEVGLIEGEVELSYFNYQGAGTLRFPMSVEGFILQPANLGVNLDDSTGMEVTLNWLDPGHVSDEIFFGSGIPSQVLPTSGTLPTQVAKKFKRSDLLFYNDRHLEQVSVALADANAAVTVKIYTDEFSETPVFSIPIEDPESFSWNTVVLPEPLRLDTLDFLWISYEIIANSVAGQVLVATTDRGPAAAGSGDLIKVGDIPWTTLSQMGVSKNFGIKGILSGDDTKSLSGSSESINKANTPPNFMGFRIYRDGELLVQELVHDNTFTDQLNEGGDFTYGVSAMFTYGESEPVEVSVNVPVVMDMPVEWGFELTSAVHNIHIPEDIAQMGLRLSRGDMLGVFYYDQDGLPRSAGAAIWEGQHTVLTAYGNDPNTEFKDGFEEGDTLLWRLFAHETGEIRQLNVAYMHDMPHYDGNFHVMGTSLIYLLKADEVSVNVFEQPEIALSAYPNPSNGTFTLQGLREASQITIYDAKGRVVWSDLSGGFLQKIELTKSGNYIIEIIDREGNATRLRQIVF